MATRTLKETVMHDHREIKLFYDQYKNAADAESKEKWSNQYTWVVTRHSVSEEIVVYPLFEKKLGEEGKKMADKDRTEHREVKVLLARVGNLSVGTPEHENVLSKVNDCPCRAHERRRGTRPPSVGVLSCRRRSLTMPNVNFRGPRLLHPRGPHPSAPDKPPYEILAGFLALPMDKIKDLFSKFPTEEEIKAAKGKAGI
ncbi:hypothetical protein BKA82DRAFT_2973288 [Pisolithus tinctorius]|nr:hypothetical protein BKA82DRAFT_2973288 [Pisolithus tinctorius]